MNNSRILRIVEGIGWSVVWMAGPAVAAAQSISTPYQISTYAGTAVSGDADGVGSAAQFSNPTSIAVDSSGNSYVVDCENQTIRKILPGGVVTTLAGSPGVAGSADGVGSAATFRFYYQEIILGEFYPVEGGGIVADPAGNLYVADTGNCTIRKITPAGVVTTFAGTAGAAGSADGTGSTAQFRDPRGLALDAAGNLYVADSGNDTIRKITPAGVVTTLAGSPGVAGSANGMGSAATFGSPYGVAVDASGNVYVSEVGNNIIREITPLGQVSTLAGLAGTGASTDGIGSAARFLSPSALAIDAAGILVVADSGNDAIRLVEPATGVVTTAAGLPGSPGNADGAGSSARFDYPMGIAVDAAGNVAVADTFNEEIRTGLAAAAPPVILTQPQAVSVTAGGLFTLSVVAAGNGPLSYQWYFNGAAITGQISSSYAKGNAQAADAGSYTVAVADAGGSVSSAAAAVTVAQLPAAPSSSEGGGGGGGAPSWWFYGLLAAVVLGRVLACRRAKGRFGEA